MKMDNNKCPVCGDAGDADYDEIGWNGDGTITILWYCLKCRHQWDDVYRFERRENLKKSEDM